MKFDVTKRCFAGTSHFGVALFQRRLWTGESWWRLLEPLAAFLPPGLRLETEIWRPWSIMSRRIRSFYGHGVLAVAPMGMDV
jgi:hypothetical protein